MYVKFNISLQRANCYVIFEMAVGVVPVAKLWRLYKAHGLKISQGTSVFGASDVQSARDTLFTNWPTSYQVS